MIATKMFWLIKVEGRKCQIPESLWKRGSPSLPTPLLQPCRVYGEAQIKRESFISSFVMLFFLLPFLSRLERRYDDEK